MGKIMKSAAFANGVATYTPDDPWAAFICNHDDVFSWLSGEGVALRTLNSVWDDLVDAEKVYYSTAAAPYAPKTSMRVGNFPSIEIQDNGQLKADFTVPQSYTFFLSFQLDNGPNGVTLISGPSNAQPRFWVGGSTDGELRLSHSSTDTLNSATDAVDENAANIACVRYDAATNAASIYVNSLTPQTATFAADHPVLEGFGVGGYRDVDANSAEGVFGDVIGFSSALPDAEVDFILKGLARRAQVEIA